MFNEICLFLCQQSFDNNETNYDMKQILVEFLSPNAIISWISFKLELEKEVDKKDMYSGYSSLTTVIVALHGQR